jgi:KaiC/GvpD/RAD55 family RecA-like ATPase
VKTAEPLLSGIAELDELLGGGLDRGTNTLFMGPSGFWQILSRHAVRHGSA